MKFGNNNNNNHPCRYCTVETGRYAGCKSECERYKSVKETRKPSRLELKEKAENKCGHYMGYIFYPDGRIRGHNIEFLNIRYSKNIPYVVLSENGISYKFRLDKAMFRAFHPDFDINKDIEILHNDGNQRNCRISNLYVNSASYIEKLVAVTI